MTESQDPNPELSRNRLLDMPRACATMLLHPRRSQACGGTPACATADRETGAPPERPRTRVRPLLSIATSGTAGSVALLRSDGRVVERPLAEGSARGRALLPAVQGLVAEAGIEGADLGAVAVSLGPGSYTGIRIGVTAAKALAWALSCELVGVSTLEALAREATALGVPEGTKRLVPAIDARRGEVYAGIFDLDDTKVARASEDMALAPEELLRRLGPGDHVFGTAVAACGEALGLVKNATSADGPADASASTIARIGAEMLARGETLDPHDASPTYLRRTEAEMKKG